jgi:hypothetical protein
MVAANFEGDLDYNEPVAMFSAFLLFFLKPVLDKSVIRLVKDPTGLK